MNWYPFNQDYLLRLREGDPETTTHFFAYFTQLLSRKLRSRKLPEKAIDDLIQKTFLRALIRINAGKFNDAARLGAYINGICNEITIEYYRGSNGRAKN